MSTSRVDVQGRHDRRRAVEHVVAPQTTFTLPYSIQVADRVIHEAELRGTETMTVAQILAAVVERRHGDDRAQLLGETRLKKWIAQFGFGQQTGIDFPGESAGLLPSYWSGSTIGNVPIGQGVSVTRCSWPRSTRAIANNGVWVQPHLVDHVQGEKRAVGEDAAHPLPGRRPQMLQMLKGVVSDTGTAAGGGDPRLHRRRQDRHRAEAGTARLRAGQVRRDVRRDGAGEQPAPRVLVSVDEPHGEIYGGIVAAPAFAQIAGFDLSTSRCRPTRARKPRSRR